jgi:hypothetical protein
MTPAASPTPRMKERGGRVFLGRTWTFVCSIYTASANGDFSSPDWQTRNRVTDRRRTLARQTDRASGNGEGLGRPC